MATEVIIPMLGVTVEKGKVVEWLKNEGDTVEKGESIFVVEADKVTTEVESPASGILAKILLPAEEEVPVLTVVGVITEPGETIPDHYLQKKSGSSPGSDFRKDRVPGSCGKQTAKVSGPTCHVSDTVKIVPAARKLAQEKGLDIKSISPSGPDGVITYQDVVRAFATAEITTNIKVSTLARRQAENTGISLENIQGSGVRGRIMREDLNVGITNATVGETVTMSGVEMDSELGKIIPMDGMRQTIARRLSNSAFTAPHVAFYTDISMDALLSYRKTILNAFEKKYELRPSINDFLIKAVALTILEFPMLNGILKGDEIHILPNINVGLAVAIPNGLVVPAITDADKYGLAEIVRQRSDLVPRALNGGLTMEEMERGTFTISSLAQSDITFFTSILNPPQSGILSVGKTRDELALVDGEVTVKHVSTMGLAVDHRIIDGALAANFLQNLKEKLEAPAFTFMHS